MKFSSRAERGESKRELDSRNVNYGIFRATPKKRADDGVTNAATSRGVQSAKALDEKWSRYLSLQELILVVPRTPRRADKFSY